MITLQRIRNYSANKWGFICGIPISDISEKEILGVKKYLCLLEETHLIYSEVN